MKTLWTGTILVFLGLAITCLWYSLDPTQSFLLFNRINIQQDTWVILCFISIAIAILATICFPLAIWWQERDTKEKPGDSS